MLGQLTESEKMLDKITALEAKVHDDKLGIDSDEYKEMHQLSDDFIEKTKPLIFKTKRNESNIF
jgi:hypothetical protein